MKLLQELLKENNSPEEMVSLLYPKEGNVKASTIMGWAEDAFDSGDLDHKPQDLADAIEQLEDAGIITLSRRKKQEKDFY